MSEGKPPARKPWAQPLAHLVAPCLKPAVAPYGFSESDLLLYWPEIVGARLSARCRPLRMKWPKHAGYEGAAREPATLIVQVEGAFAIELQHQAQVLIERINVHFGWRCVGRLAFRQGPVPRPPAPRVRPAEPEPEVVRAAEQVAHGIDEEALRAAMVRLGSRVLSVKPR